MKRVWAGWLIGRANMRRFVGLRTRERHHFLSAERLFTRVLELDSKHLNARINRGLLRWRELDNWAGAITDFTTVLDLYPAYALALFYRGMAFSRAGDYQAAAQDLSAFVNADPTSHWARHASIQLESLRAILDELPRMLPAPRHELHSGE